MSRLDEAIVSLLDRCPGLTDGEVRAAVGCRRSVRDRLEALAAAGRLTYACESGDGRRWYPAGALPVGRLHPLYVAFGTRVPERGVPGRIVTFEAARRSPDRPPRRAFGVQSAFGSGVW